MALPEKVIEQLSRGDAPDTPGWASGLLMFSGGLLAIVLLIYFGLILGYEPYLNAQTAQLDAQLTTLGKTISPSDQTTFIAYYSEIANIRSTLANHVTMSRFFTWLEQNTEANVYYTALTIASGNAVTLNGSAKTEADVSQQLAIFENAPAVQKIFFSGVTYVAESNTWQFMITLTMDPAAVFRASTSPSS